MGTAGDNPEEGGDDVKSSCPSRPGLHTCYNGATEGCEAARRSEPQKQRPSSDCSLQPGCTKPESLVIADQNAAVNTFPGLVHTARHTMGAGDARSQWPNREGGAAEGGPGDWGEVVTR